MANTSELEKGLNELKRLTGITLAVTAEDSEQEQIALEQIRCLCLAYREKYNKNDFLMGLDDRRCSFLRCTAASHGSTLHRKKIEFSF